MAGGRKVEVYNTRERLLSTDHNREQSFMADDTAEEYRKLLSTLTVRDASNSEEVETSGTVSDPLEGHILGGLMVDPQGGSDNLLVTPGVCYLVDPDGVTGSSDPNPASPDDNEFKFVKSDGEQVLGTLQIADNPAGTIRIDVVECRRIPVNVDETDNRDIFDPSTGLFAATAVDKVVRSELEFRVRQGVAGAGFPGTVQGWMPLCVISVPALSSTPNVDNSTFWDVRPLVRDRVEPPFANTRLWSRSEQATAYCDDISAAAVSHPVSGFCEGELIGWRCGGTLRSGVPGTGDGDAIDILAAANQDGGVVLLGVPWTLWALFPFGLVRWVRYNETGSPRRPGPFRGIPVISQVSTLTLSHQTPFVAIALPASTGLAGTTSVGTALLTMQTLTGAAVPLGGTHKHGLFLHSKRNQAGGVSLGAATAVAGAPGNPIQAYWNVPNGLTGIPGNARAMVVEFEVQIFDAAVTSVEVNVDLEVVLAHDLASTSPAIVFGGTKQTTSVETDGGGLTQVMRVTAEIPIHEDYPVGTHSAPSVPGLPDQRVGIIVGPHTGAAWAFSTTNARLRGWRLSGQ